MKVSQNFFLTEFIPKIIHEQFRENGLWFIDPRIITLAQFTRDFFAKSITINNWFDEGIYHDSGYRTPTSPTGKPLSQHRFGRAIDIKVDGIRPKEVHAAIIANESKFMAAGLTTLENINATPTWVHMDIRNTGMDKILIVNP